MTVGVAVVASAALIFVAYQINLIEVGEALRGRGGAVAQRLDLFGANGSDFQTQESVDRMLQRQSFVAAVVFSPSREIIASAPSTAVLGPTLSSWPDSDDAIEAVSIEGVTALAVAVPLTTGGRAWIVFDRSPYTTAESRLRQAWVIVGSVAVLVALALSLLVGGGRQEAIAQHSRHGPTARQR